ncbi:hypothetical protein [Streptomyces qinzhouensis]|uniref:Uncharacterized protein n=1 Tax=Streptomyces qinzhouensis TaxID=2599401 RepID=A0A5B8ICA1_9ACTN|nr:hypothetical protein [Streptomyces qinzhouensis]QDY75432.1 hypothetical protein FQU76_01705 [Streptomyces qinzhouensis]
MSDSPSGPQAQPSVVASGERAIATGSSIGVAVTGDHNVISCYLLFGGTSIHGSKSAEVDPPLQPLATAEIKAFVPVLIGIVNWVGQSASLHPGRRLVRSYVENTLGQVGTDGVIAYGQELDSGETLLLFTGVEDVRALGAVLLHELDKMMAADWERTTRKAGYLLPQIRLVLHAGFGEFDGSRVSGPSLVDALRSHSRTTAMNDAGTGDAVGVVALITHDAFDAELYAQHRGVGRGWIPFTQRVPGDAPSLDFWFRGDTSRTASR